MTKKELHRESVGNNLASSLSRRRLLEAGGSAVIAAGTISSFVAPRRARAQQKTLRILQWKHFVPSYDAWFNDTYVKEWGEQNETRVIVDNVGLGDIGAGVAAEAEARQGHDLLMWLAAPALYEDQVIDHREIYEECERRYDNASDFAIKSTYNPKTNKYFGFCSAFLPALLTYRKDLWDAVAGTPDSWDDIRRVGRQIKLLHGSPVGISLAPEHNSEHTLRAILHSFGASVQDGEGNPTLKSKETLEALKYVKALYQEALTEEMLSWDAASNNRFMLTGEGCLTLDTMSIVRASETTQLPVANDLRLARAPEGPVGRLAPSFGIFTYFIWSFAENVAGAKQFLVDYTARSQDGFLASGFQNMPSFLETAPDLTQLVANDPNATPPDKYRALADGPTWTTNIGYPGYTNAATAEVYAKGLLPTMCARAATGELTPEEALDQADQEVRDIFRKWQERGKI